MRQIFIIATLIFIVGCNLKPKNDSSENELTDKKVAIIKSNNIDTIYHYWEIDNETYKFDTIYSDLHFSIKTYCLNDSSIFSTPFENEENGKKKVEFYVAHDYESKVKFSHDNIEKEFLINMQTFKDSLPDDFMKIAHLWYNQFEKVDNGKVIMRAKVAKPDTDYQFDFIYNIDSIGDIIIKEVEYGW